METRLTKPLGRSPISPTIDDKVGLTENHIEQKFSTISPTSVMHVTYVCRILFKTKADLEEISQAEEEVVNLKKQAANLHLQLNEQNENNRGPVCASCGQPQQRANHQERQ